MWKGIDCNRNVNLYPAPIRSLHGTKYGYINNIGRLVIRPQFDFARSYQDNGLAIVEIDNHQGAIDSTGRFVVRPRYENVTDFSEGRAIAINRGNFVMIDDTGRELTTKPYSFISNFSNGRAYFSGADSQGQYLYGYLDREGKEVVPLKYIEASDFKGGIALVKVKENEYALIGLDGKVIYTYSYPFVGSLGEGLLSFKQTENGKLGYIDINGTIVINPQFTGAQAFNGGRAIVNIGEDFTDLYGLIDKSGNYIIKPEYNSISFLGEERLSIGRYLDKERPYIGQKYAIADTNGTFLTDYIYSSVENYNMGVASATNDRYTFFIDKSGKIVKDLPILSGSGTLTIDGNLIRALVDMRTSYFNKKSQLVWQQNKVIPLNYDVRVKEEKFKPDKDYLVYYPKIQGMSNIETFKNVNKRLERLSNVNEFKLSFESETSYTGDFDIEFFKKNLLVIELNSYTFPLGAAHGMPSKIYPHIDIRTGAFYELKDLFRPDSDYVKVLSDIIDQQIKTNPEYEYVFPDSYKGIKEDQPFYVDENTLYIYFFPYDIAPYAAGFPTFKIPFKDIMNIINTQGEFWKAFN